MALEPTYRYVEKQAGMVQRRAARYCTNRYHNTSSVTEMLGDFHSETLEARRTKIQLTMLFKIVNDLVDIPSEEYMSLASTRTRKFQNKRLRQYSTRTDTFKYSFFPRTIPVWNSLPANIAEAPDLVHFKLGLSLGSWQPASRIRGFLELCRLADHTQGQLL